MNTDKYIEGELYVSRCPEKGKGNRCWFSSDELPPLPKGKSLRVKAHFEIIPEKSIVLEGESKDCLIYKLDGGANNKKYVDWMEAHEGKKVRLTLEVIEDEDGK
jgi:hypothetical protein